MTDLISFDFEGLDESALGYHPQHGAIVHKTKFMAWLGLDTGNASRTEDRHLGANDVVKGVFSPIGGKAKGGRKADALTKRGVRRLLFRSDKAIAVEYADRVLDMLDELDRSGMVVDEARITDEQIVRGIDKLTTLARARIAEKSDWRVILDAMRLGGAEADDYPAIQNFFYRSLFGLSAKQIKLSQKQVNGERYKRTGELKPSTAAKDYLTEEQLRLLDAAVLATKAQIDVYYPAGDPPVSELQDMATDAIRLLKPRAVSGGAA